MRRLPAAAALIPALFSPMPASASCVFSGQAVEVEITDCRQARDLVDVRLSTELEWVRIYATMILEKNIEIVVLGRRLRAAPIEFASEDSVTLGKTLPGTGVGAWVMHEESVSCAEFPTGELAYFSAEPACCDVIPPGDAACLLGVANATLLPQELVAELVTGE